MNITTKLDVGDEIYALHSTPQTTELIQDTILEIEARVFKAPFTDEFVVIESYWLKNYRHKMSAEEIFRNKEELYEYYRKEAV